MRRGLTVVLVFCAGLGAAGQFGKISVPFADLGAVYAMAGPVAMGWMVSIVGLAGLFLGAVAGMVVGPFGVRRSMVAALLMGALASLLQAGLPPYPVMMALRVLEGASHLAIVVAGPVLMARAATPATLGLVMALWGSFFGVSFAALAALVPMLLQGPGLWAVFAGHAAWLAACALALWVVLPPDPPMTRLTGDGWVRRHLAIYASPRVAAPGLGFFCYTILFVALLTLLPPEVPPAQRAVVAFWMPLAAILVSLTFGVWVLRYLSAVQTVQLGFALASLCCGLLWLFWGQGWGHGWGMALAALALSGAFGLVQGASFAAIAQLNASGEARAMAAGALAQMGNLGTVTGTPLLAWALTTDAGANAVLAVCLPFCLLGVVLHSVQTRRRLRNPA